MVQTVHMHDDRFDLLLTSKSASIHRDFNCRCLQLDAIFALIESYSGFNSSDVESAGIMESMQQGLLAIREAAQIALDDLPV